MVWPVRLRGPRVQSFEGKCAFRNSSGLAAWTSWLGSGNLTTKRSFLPPDRDLAVFSRPLNYFISYNDHSAAKWRLWFDWKERTQDRECLRSKQKENECKHCCKFPARCLYRNQSPFIILLRDLPAQVLKTRIERRTYKKQARRSSAILAKAENFGLGNAHVLAGGIFIRERI
jgi:hypothetical protein